jgi:methyl-accepting chemotaxis protein
LQNKNTRATATKEIKALIKDAAEKMQDGTSLVSKSGQALDEIVTSVKQVTGIMGELAEASREQATGIEHVNRAVTQMDHVVQTNSVQTEEVSLMAQALMGQAEQLQILVGRFTLRESLMPQGEFVGMSSGGATSLLQPVVISPVAGVPIRTNGYGNGQANSGL